MPLYEYRCGACAKVFEEYARHSERDKEGVCPSCGEGAVKLGISLFPAKGSGGGSGAGGRSCGGGSGNSPFR